MDEHGHTDAVSVHYASGDLGEKILSGLRTSGKDPDALKVEDPASVDQMHSGGFRRHAT